MQHGRSSWLLMLGVLLAWGCGGDPEVEDTTAVVRVEVSPELARLEVDEELQLETRAYNGRGNLVPGAAFTFKSNAPEVASVSKEGVVRGLRPGVAVITAAVGARRATMEVAVNPPVHSIQIEPDPVELETGDSMQLSAIAFDESGERLDDRTFTWSVENERVATIDENGVITALRREDVTEVIARFGDAEGRANVLVRKKIHSIEIKPDPIRLREKEEILLTATLRDDGGTMLSGREVSWSTTDEAIATVNEEGLLRGIVPGSTSVVAKAGGLTVEAPVEVLPERVFRLQIEPEEAEVVVGETLQFTVRMFNEEGKEIFDRPLLWNVVDLDLDKQDYAKLAAQVDEDGLLTAKRPLNGRVDVMVPGDAVTAMAHIRIVLRMEAVSAGQHHTCALTGGGQAFCWGSNFKGQTGGAPPHDIPVPVETELRFRSVAAGAAHSCGLTEEGEAYCWGENTHGQLGNATEAEKSLIPVRVEIDPNTRFAKIYAGDSYSCAIDREDRAWCWGYGGDGRLGTALSSDSNIPVRVAPWRPEGEPQVDIPFRELSLGKNPERSNTFTCGISTSGQSFCWGTNELADYGIGGGPDNTFASSPVPVAGGHLFASIAVGATHACGLTEEGEAYCWGRGGSGELGDDFSDDPDWLGDLGHHRQSPHPVDTEIRFDQIVAGSKISCAITAEGELYCWGEVDSAIVFDKTPRRMGASTDWVFQKVASGVRHFCGIDEEFVVFCWGANFQNQLGNTLPTIFIPLPSRIFPEQDPL